MPRILLISEARLFDELERSFVRRPGYTLVWTKDGEVLAHEALTGGADLIVGAVEMPALSGYDLCARLRAKPATASVPILLIGDASARERAKLAGASELLPVPWTRSQLFAAIRNVMHVPERAADRAPVSLRVACRIDGESYIAFTRDISSTGLFLKGVSLAGPGARLQMKLQIPAGGKSIEYDLVGEVVRKTGRDPRGDDLLRRPPPSLAEGDASRRSRATPKRTSELARHGSSVPGRRGAEGTARAVADFDEGAAVQGVGVRFLDLSVDSRLPLARFVRERSGR